jgi:hypothetical protein
MRVMKMPKPLPFCLALLFGCAVAIAQDAPKDQSYEIKLARPLKVGQKYALTADGALLRQVKVTRGGTTHEQPEEGYGVRLEATVEILALDETGEESKISCAVDKCARITGEGETELLAKGKVFIAEGKGKDTKFSLPDGGELPKDATDALDLVISMDTNDKLTDDDMLGTKEKKKVGESWAVTPQAIAKDSERVGVEVKAEDVDGSFRLDGLEKVGDVECLKMSGNLRVKKLVTKADATEDDGLPEGFVVDNGSMEAKYTGLFPVDASVGSLAETASVTFVTFIKGGAAGDEVAIESRVQRAIEMKRRWLDQ